MHVLQIYKVYYYCIKVRGCQSTNGLNKKKWRVKSRMCFPINILRITIFIAIASNLSFTFSYQYQRLVLVHVHSQQIASLLNQTTPYPAILFKVIARSKTMDLWIHVYIVYAHIVQYTLFNDVIGFIFLNCIDWKFNYLGSYKETCKKVYISSIVICHIFGILKKFRWYFHFCRIRLFKNWLDMISRQLFLNYYE